MNYITFETGTFEVNCSIIDINGKAWIVDPGADAGLIAEKLEKLGLEPEEILLTHGHFDHVGAVGALQKRYPSLRVRVTEADEQVLVHPLNQFPPEYPPVGKPANIMRPHELAGVTVIDTPGHTPGGVCYYFPEAKTLFAGDTLFAGSVGRTDLPGGDMQVLMKSLEKLKALPPDTVVVPGHGRSTTIARELESNPFLTGL